MPSGAPWSVKGIDPRARAIAKTAARKEGLTLGEWLNRVILDDGEPGAGWDDRLENFHGFGSGGGDDDDSDALRAVVDRLAERLEAAERRSTLAISGVDQSLNALTRRLDALEDEAEDEDGALDAALSRARSQHDELLDRVRKLERSGPGGTDPAALKAVEGALGKLAGRLYETERDVRAEIDNLTHREEERASLSQKALKSVKSLADQVAESERRLASEQTDLRERVEAEARARTEALSGAEDRARSLQGRIIAAENATHRAAETLAQSHERLEVRLRALEGRAGQAVGADEINQRFELLGRELADLIRETRQDCARQISELNASGTAAPQLERALEAAEARLTLAETRQSDALARIGQEVSRLARAVDKRIEEAERRLERKFNDVESRREGRESRADFETRLERVRAENTEAVRRIGEQMARLGESLADRVHQAEARSAHAVEQAGERMAQVVEKLKTKQTSPRAVDLDERIRASEERTAKRIEDAMQGVHARLDQARTETADALSPVQRAMSALADRLEAIEQRGGPAKSGEAAALKIEADSVSLDPSTPLPQPPGLRDEAAGEDWNQDPGAVRDSFVMDAEAPRPKRRSAEPELERLQVEEPAEAPAPPRERPAPRLGATADADFLASARKTVRANASATQWSPPPEPSEGGGGRKLLIGASVLGFVAVAAAAGMLAMEALNGGDEPARAARPDDGGSLSTLFADPQPGSTNLAEDVDAAAEATPEAAETATQTDPQASLSQTVETTPSDQVQTRPAASTEPAPQIAVEPMSLETAAANGNAIARYQLALQRLEAGARSDGAALMRRAAEQGVPDAMRRFGLMQARGEGVPADPAAGRALVVAAAEVGNIQAMHDAGGLFINAEGVTNAEQTAAQWFQQGALHGVRDSQFNMALLFQEGFGVAQSAADAYAWFLIAAEAGDTDAAGRAAALRRELTPEARAAAEQAARDFTPRPADPSAQGQYPAHPWETGPQGMIARTQTLLAELGYDPGPADGVMGDLTRRAIVSYQRAEGLEPGAPLDARLVARLERSAAD